MSSDTTKKKRSLPHVVRWAILLLIGVVIALVPCPGGLDQKAWYCFAIFVATIVGFMIQAAPMGVLSIVALALVAILNLAPITTVLSSFGSTTAWIILCAFFLARGIKKTGLGRRIALILIRLLGRSTLSVAYALTFAETIMGAAMPSIMARSGGVMYPIASGVCDVYDSKPGPSGKKIGNYLVQMEGQVACIVSAMFMTAMASNPLVVELALSTANLTLSWMQWMLAALVPGLLSLILVPLVLYKIEKPIIRKTPEAREMAVKQLEEMGPMGFHEKVQLIVFVGCLALWGTSNLHGINATTVAIIGVAVLLVTGVLTWDDCLSEKSGWDSFIWIAALMQMANLITDGGILNYFAEWISPYVSNMPWLLALIVICLLYLYSEYFFASMTSHITALYGPLLLVCIAAGAPPMMAALVLAMMSNVCGGITNYAGGHMPVWFGAGYVDQGTWWRNGFICSLINVATFLGVGSFWWNIIGLY